MNNFLNKLKQSLYKFMMNRYGTDDLYKFTITMSFIFMFLYLFTRSTIFYFLEMFFLLFSVFRAFSKNRLKRSNENRVYLKYTKKIRSFFNLQKRIFKDRKNYKYMKCPHCGQILRLPKTKGKHIVKCPHCFKEFDVKI